MTERDWFTLINKRAALREQFPSLQKVARERPGTTQDRAEREFWHADNRRTYHPMPPTVAEQDANRFIIQQRQRTQAEFLARLELKHNGRKTA